MIATHTQQAAQAASSKALAQDSAGRDRVRPVGPLATQVLMPSTITMHHPSAGLNALVDGCGQFFSLIGHAKRAQSPFSFITLQKELIHEINAFHESALSHGFLEEYIAVCRYVLCAFADDVLSHLLCGGQEQWCNYTLLGHFKLDLLHHDKFFSILERTSKEPTLYIDLMELMYICLSMGYKGQYRSKESDQCQLEQITIALYQRIRAYRGTFSKTLSPVPSKPVEKMPRPMASKNISLLQVLLFDACMIMAIFISLGYLMDVLSNEVLNTIVPMETTLFHKVVNP